MIDPIVKIDAVACLKGGDVAGEYLEEIGKFDLASLTREEWTTFCVKLVGGAFLFAVGPVHGQKAPF